MELNPSAVRLVNSGVIEAYIQRVTELSQSRQRLPTRDELEAIATELGIEPEEIQAAQQQAQDHYTRAQGYARLSYWEEAIGELQEAVALNPGDPAMLVALAQAHLGRWQQRHQRQDCEQLHLRVKQCLSLQPDSEAALELLANFRRSQQQRGRWLLGGGLLLGAVSLGSLGYLFLQGGMPFVIEEKARLESLQSTIARQQAELERLQYSQRNLERELRQQREKQGLDHNIHQQRLDRLHSELNQLKQRLSSLENPLTVPTPEPQN